MNVTAREPKPGRVWSLGISRSVGRRPLLSALRSIDGVKVIETSGFFSRMREKPICTFEYKEQKFIIEAEWPAFDSFEITPTPRGCKDQTADLFRELRKRLDESR
jgi:hypothetical protein